MASNETNNQATTANEPKPLVFRSLGIKLSGVWRLDGIMRQALCHLLGIHGSSTRSEILDVLVGPKVNVGPARDTSKGRLEELLQQAFKTILPLDKVEHLRADYDRWCETNGSVAASPNLQGLELDIANAIASPEAYKLAMDKYASVGLESVCDLLRVYRDKLMDRVENPKRGKTHAIVRHAILNGAAANWKRKARKATKNGVTVVDASKIHETQDGAVEV